MGADTDTGRHEPFFKCIRMSEEKYCKERVWIREGEVFKNKPFILSGVVASSWEIFG